MTRKNVLGSKISDQERYFAQKLARITIYVNSAGRFQIPLPAFARQVLGYERVGGNTKDEAESALLKAERDYTEKMEAKQKVIVYKIEVSAFIMDAEGKRCVFRADEIRFAEGTGLVLGWRILYRHTRPDVDEVTYHQEDGTFEMLDTHNGERVKWIPWTQQAEDFFMECQKRLENLGMNLWNFLHQSQDQIEGKIMEASRLLDYKPIQGDS